MQRGPDVWYHLIEETYSYPHVWKFPENILKYLYGGLLKSVNFFWDALYCFMIMIHSCVLVRSMWCDLRGLLLPVRWWPGEAGSGQGWVRIHWVPLGVHRDGGRTGLPEHQGKLFILYHNLSCYCYGLCFYFVARYLLKHGAPIDLIHYEYQTESVFFHWIFGFCIISIRAYYIYMYLDSTIGGKFFKCAKNLP